MSAATDTFTDIVHVRLLGEGVDVWRPVRARKLPSGAYELASDPVPQDEKWEFGPGERVTVKDRSSPEGMAAIAVARVSQGSKHVS